MHANHQPALSKVTDHINGACIADEMQATLLALGEAVEFRDGHTGTHCQRLAYLGVAMGVCMDLGRNSLAALYRGGYLHDVGKVAIPDSILLKQGKLTPDEWDTMRTHTTMGEHICRHMKSLAEVLPIIRSHHERWDGTGYPDGLKGEQIPLLARIVQVVDIYDALTNPRPYHTACSADEAFRIISEETERGWRDPQVVRVFLALSEEVLLRPRRDGSPEAIHASLANLDQHVRDAPLPVEGMLRIPPV